MLRFFLLVLSSLLLCSLVSNANPARQWADSVFARLSNDEKITQLMMIAAYANRDDQYERELIREAVRYNVGGIMFLQGKATQQAHLINRLQEKAKTPMLIALDAEWGVSMRLDSALSFPLAMTLGALEDDSLIREMGQAIGDQLKASGVHVNFAPVVDVNNNPNNPVINFRSFGENPERVSSKGIAYMHGLHDAGIMATAKHFPGHGDTDRDSHYALPLIQKDKKALWKTELYPFKQMIREKVDGIMVAHLYIPSLDPTPNRASTLSPVIIRHMLKDSLQFQGLVYTDALNMKGVSNYYAPGELEVLALQAGNDILLMPDDVGKALRAIKKAIQLSPELMQQIDSSVVKLLRTKYQAGLHQRDTLDLLQIHTKLNKEKDKALTRQLYAQSLTLLKNQDETIPFKELGKNKIASVAIGASCVNTFQRYQNLYTQVDHYHLPKNAPLNQFIDLQNQLKKYDHIILSLHNTSKYPKGNYGITHQSVIFAQELAKQNSVTLTHFANPYSLNFFDELRGFQAILIAYEDNPFTQELAAQALFGGIPIKGSLPVSIQYFPEGTGIHTKKIRIGYVLPEELGIDGRFLLQADSIARRAIETKATPGCQIAAARNGYIFYRKSFGYHTYKQERKVEHEHLYDIASITKIASTLPETMRLYEAGKIELEQAISHYLPEVKGSNKADLTLLEILTHQAQLWPWIPFYRNAFQLLMPEQELFSKKLSDTHPFKLDTKQYINRNFTLDPDIFRTHADSLFSIPVTDNLYMNNKYISILYDSIHQSKLWPEKEYRYSDLGYYYLQMIIELMQGQPLDELVETDFFPSLGLFHTYYNPLQKTMPAEIVQTENDKHFRKQLLHGHVHDPGAAMLGGVAGHAGLFSNASDLSILMQLYLNKGEYGGIRYFAPETIELFTSSPFQHKENRRGIGFDKAEPDQDKSGPACASASDNSFGHSGFTGTIAWADPDYQLTYVFLSNRIHPNADNTSLISENIRTEIQQVFYDALGIPHPDEKNK